MISNGSQIPPKLSVCLTSSGFFEGLREVAITLWPFLRARRESAVPKPDEQPVMSQTRGLVLGDILGFGIENIGINLSCLLIEPLSGWQPWRLYTEKGAGGGSSGWSEIGAKIRRHWLVSTPHQTNQQWQRRSILRKDREELFDLESES